MPSTNKKAAAVGLLILLVAACGVFLLIRHLLTDSSATVVVVPATQPQSSRLERERAVEAEIRARLGQTAPEPAIVPAPKGSVRGPDGKPVAGADVILSSFTAPARLYDRVGPAAPTVKTDAQGQFIFATAVPAWAAIIARCDAGYAQVLADEFAAAKSKITLQPWGKIEGLQLPGGKSVANEQITLDVIPNDPDLIVTQPGRPMQRVPVYYRQSATTDADGRFVFTKVVPGELTVGRMTLAPQGYMETSNSVYVHMEPGVTAQVTLGGAAGRPVIGSIVATGAEEPLVFTGRIVSSIGGVIFASTRPTTQAIEQFRASANRPPFDKPANWDQLSPEVQQRLQAKWDKRPWSRSSSYPVTVCRDGSFRAENIPPGRYYATFYAEPTSFAPGTYVTREILATARAEFTINDIPAGQSVEPLDLGRITAPARKRVTAGQFAPELTAQTLDGQPWKLSDRRGKYVILHTWGMTMFGTSSATSSRYDLLNSLYDRFIHDKRFLMVGLYMGSTPEKAKELAAAEKVPGTLLTINMRDDSARTFLNSMGQLLLIDPEGRVASRSPGPLGLYEQLEVALGKDTAARPDVKVTVEHIPGEKATAAFAFATIPTISATDAGQQAVFTIVAGQKAPYAAGLRVLSDGRGPRSPEDESGETAFGEGTLAGRLKADLGKATPISQVNTYSWYKNGNRWPQVYRLYASDGAGPGFNPEPNFGTDPTTCGWTHIASVDTRPTAGGADLRDNMGGQDGVNIAGSNGTLGNYRYFLFEIFATQTRTRWTQTFYSEIDIVGK